MENDNPVERKLTRGRSERVGGGRGGGRGGKGGLGTILACFRDTKPSNDFESTRLVARIIQFEYVYGACGASDPRAHIYVPIGTRVIPTCIYRGLYLLAFSLSLSPLLHSCNIDITVKRIYRPFSSCPPLPRHGASRRSFFHLYLSTVFLSNAARVPTFVGNGSSVIEHVCRDILIFPARAIIHARTSEIFL